MGTTPYERGLRAGANSAGYRQSAFNGGGMADPTHPPGWRNSLIARVETSDHVYWGNAWKPGINSKPGQLKLDVHVGRRLAYLLFLESPVDTCEINGAPQPAFVLMSEGYANPSSPVSGYRQINVCEERSPEDSVLAGLCRGVRDSAYARRLGTLVPEEIRRHAQGKVVLQARVAGLPHVEIKYV